MLSFKRPSLYCPFQSKIHAQTEAIRQRLLFWVQQYELFSPEVRLRFPADQYAELVARVFPTALPESLDLLIDWNVWLFARDDLLVETGIGRTPARLNTFNERLLEILYGDRCAAHDISLVQALDDFCQRLRRVASPGCLDRFIQAVEDYFAASVWEATQYVQGCMPDLYTYYIMRPFAGAVYTDFAFIEISNGFELPANMHQHVLIQRIKQFANTACSFANDIFSLSKETEDGESMNLVLVLQHQYGLTLQEAINRAAIIHDEQVQAFETLAEQLPLCGIQMDVPLQQYLDGLRAWMRGNIDWSLTCGRYNVVPQMQEVAV